MGRSEGKRTAVTNSNAKNGHVLPACETFPQFCLLPLEIRLLIWEATWPGPQLIAISRNWMAINSSSVEPEAVQGSSPPKRWYCYLRRYGSITSFWSSFDSRHFNTHVFDLFKTSKPGNGLGPVALRVCYESRAHTLRHFVVLRHKSHDNVDRRSPKIPGGPIYLNMVHDVLWLDKDVTNEFSDAVADLRDGYGEAQLDKVRNVMFGECVWNLDEETHDNENVHNEEAREARREARYPLGYYSRVLAAFGGIRRVQVLMVQSWWWPSPTNPERDEFAEWVAALSERDCRILTRRGLPWTVQYIDHMGKAHGEVRSKCPQV